MYEGIVYFAGPKSRFDGRIHAEEIIARTGWVHWRWHARLVMLGIHRTLDPSRCGYALIRGEDCIEHYDPPLPTQHVSPSDDEGFEDGMIIDGLAGVERRRSRGSHR